MPVAVKRAEARSSPADTIPQLPKILSEIFNQAQHSLAVHRKLTVSLFQTHLSVSSVTQETPKGTKLVGEKAFNDAFLTCINRCLPVKKGEQVADRCLKFAGSYASYAQAKFREAQAEEKDDDGEDEEDDTTATRFVEILLKHLLRGFHAKNKSVRLRCCQIVALLVNGLESMDDDLFETLKTSLLERVNDKESNVRVQAIVALAKLQQAAGEDEDAADEEDEVNETLVWMLRNDSSAEVRRAALFNLALNPTNFPYVIERLRDVDVINRRCVFLGSLAMLPALLTANNQRAKLLDKPTTNDAVGIGLKDREESVRRATKKLMGTWIDACSGDLEQFLQRFDLLSSDIAEQALSCMLEQRPALLDHVPLVGSGPQDRDAGDAFWNGLTPARTLMAKVTLNHLREKPGMTERWEEAMPPVTALAFRIQKHFNAMIDELEKDGEESDAVREQSRIVSLLLDIALHADYADEIGRRKMFGLLREMMSHSLLLSLTLINGCLDLMLKLSNGQRDFMRIVVEITQQLEEDEDAVEENEENTAARDARRLLIVRGMLERVGGALQENTAVHGLLPQLIVPAVRSKDAEIREQGLVCLGLSCFLDRNLALDSFPLFVDQMQRGAERVKLAAVQLVFDLVIVHGLQHLVSRNVQGTREELGAEAYDAEVKKACATLLGFLLALLEDDDQAVQSAAAQGAAKLMLAGLVDDAEEVLKSIVLVYMSPETVENEELRQCLSYFLPAYSYSSPANQRRLRSVWLDTLKVLSEVYEDKDADQDMVAPPQIAMQLIDWMDSNKAIYPGTKDGSINADVALDILKEILQDNNDQRKLFTQLIGKVTLPDELDEAKANALLIMCNTISALDPFETSALANAFGRFAASVQKKYADAAAALDVQACLDQGSALAEGGATEGEEGQDAKVYADLVAFFRKNGVDAVRLCKTAGRAPAAGAPSGKRAPRPVVKGGKGAARKKTPKSDEEEEEEEEGEEEGEEEEEEDD